MLNTIIFCLLAFVMICASAVSAQDVSPPAADNVQHQTFAPMFAVPAPMVNLPGLQQFLIKLNEVPPCYDDDELCWDSCWEFIQADATIQSSPPTPAPVKLNYFINTTATEFCCLTSSSANAYIGHDSYRWRRCQNNILTASANAYIGHDSYRWRRCQNNILTASATRNQNMYPLRC